MASEPMSSEPCAWSACSEQAVQRAQVHAVAGSLGLERCKGARAGPLLQACRAAVREVRDPAEGADSAMPSHA